METEITLTKTARPHAAGAEASPTELEATSVQRGLAERPQPRSFDELVRSRRSVREFLDVEIPREEILRILEPGIYAPSSTNAQSWQFVVVTNPLMRKRLQKTVDDAYLAEYEKALGKFERTQDPQDKKLAAAIRWFSSYGKLRDAPVYVVTLSAPYDNKNTLLLATANPNAFNKIIDLTVMKSVAMAVQNILLSAENRGYGAYALDSPLYAEESIRELLGYDPHLRLIMIFALGLPAKRGANMPKRIPIEEKTLFVE